jgi:phosphoribosylaminoimidazolecarboxamide formyltransferase/IMP cyclohydrolase
MSCLRPTEVFVPPRVEVRSEGGVTLQQERNAAEITPALFARRVSRRAELSDAVLADLIIATIVAKHAPSNAVCVAQAGQAIGIGGGQQARIYATTLACDKADLWRLQHHPRAAEIEVASGTTRAARFNAIRQWLLWDTLDEADRSRLRLAVRELPTPLDPDERQAWLHQFPPVALSSDGYIPFRDNVDRARRSVVRVIAQPGGSANDHEVTAAADESDMVMVHTGLRLFWH